MKALSEYPYLCGSLVLLLVFTVTFIRVKRFRRVMVLGGLASALYSLAAVFFVPEYWQPVLVIKIPVGLEDMLFSFANGGIVLFISLWSVRDTIQVRYSLGMLTGKFLFCTLLSAVLCYVLRMAGMPVMTCCLFAMLVLGMVLLAKNRCYWPFAIRGALGFTMLYVLVTGMLSLKFPLFHNQWTMKNLWGYRFLSFPVEEYLWAFGFGAVFPLIMAFSLGITFTIRNDARQ
ncbi:hypothetical protein EH223_09550 [candidate division KSB1 bacterium]|nr:hypothetical protein [Candidatus Aminicenantes bacterium]RQW03627.1 MAG: hypothetical protein EH223_09550 [candidate division KSB1 bacterium]